MVRPIQKLNIKSDGDVFYFYKNAHNYADSLDWVSGYSFSDIYTSRLCHESLEQALLAELADLPLDEEMAFITQQTRQSEGARAKDEGDDKTDTTKGPDSTEAANAADTISGPDGHSRGEREEAEQNGSGITDQKSINIDKPQTWEDARITDTGDVPDTVTTPSPTASTSGTFYIDNLSVLLRPFLGLLNKEAVDMVFYVYKRTGVNHFNFLFSEFKNKKDLLIELHLLAVRGSRHRPFSLMDVHETLRSTGSDPFTVNSVPIACCAAPDRVFDTVVPIGGFETETEAGSQEDHRQQDSQEHQSVRPFIESRYVNPSIHLDQAHKLISSISSQGCDQRFFLENVTTFLSLRFDRELFLSLLPLPRDSYFFRMLNKFENPPFYFYKGASIAELLMDSIRIQGMARSEPTYALISDVDKQLADTNIRQSYDTNMTVPRILKDEHSVLQKHYIAMNCYTLRYFLQFCHDTFSTAGPSVRDYILIARNIHLFIYKYRHPALFAILHELMELKIEKIEKEMIESLLFKIDLYVDVFYGHGSGAGRSDSGLSDEMRQAWTIKRATATTTSTTSTITSTTSAAGDEENIPGIPSLSDPHDAIVQSFISPALHSSLQSRLERVALESFQSLYPSEIFQDCSKILNRFIIRASDKSKTLFLRRADILFSVTDRDTLSAVIRNLQAVAGSKWRYRAALILRRDKLAKLGFEPGWFREAFSADRVYFVRKLLERTEAGYSAGRV